LALFACSFQERLQGLSYGFPCIQIQADAALRLGHREQTSRDACRLRSLARMVQGDYRQRHPFERFLDVCWLVEVQMIDQEEYGFMDDLVRYHMIVIQHEDEFSAYLPELIEQVR